MCPNHSTPMYRPQRRENRYSNKSLYTDVPDSTIYNSQKVETTQISINGWMDEQEQTYPHNGILFSHKKEQSAAVCYSIDEPQKHDAKWKKPGIRGHIL